MYGQKSNEAFRCSREDYERGDKVKGKSDLNLVEHYKKRRDEFNHASDEKSQIS